MALPSRGRFSASGFLPDVRRYGVTYFNYVGKPLPTSSRRRKNPTTRTRRCVRFRQRGSHGRRRPVLRTFRLPVVDGYGSTEGGAAVSRTPDTPYGSLGLGINVIIVDPETGEECPRARFDENGRLVNADEATGEIVSTSGAAGFEGYWRNEEAERA